MITMKDIQQLKLFKVLVIGDSCTDVYKYGSVERLCPEAPVPVFKYLYETKTEGMAGNVYNNLKSLGINVDIITNLQNIKKIRYVDQKTNYLLLREDIEEKITEKIQIDINCLAQYDLIVISDYEKGLITQEIYEIVRNNFKGPIFVDTKKKDISIFKQSYIKINETEFNSLVKDSPECEIVVTLGSKGAMYKNTIYPGKVVKVFDVSGAGDSFMAGLVAGFLLTKSLQDSIPFANICAANVVKSPGTAKICLKELKHDLCI